MPRKQPAQPRAPVISLVAARIQRARPTVEQVETATLAYEFEVLETMLNAYWTALYSQIDKIRNHPEVRA